MDYNLAGDLLEHFLDENPNSFYLDKSGKKIKIDYIWKKENVEEMSKRMRPYISSFLYQFL